ncbi:TPA: hypothetical protein ACXDAZ_002585 [Clostridium botulinum]|uniref:hypothetical protein n=1 Tax=Clostridium botulinum TaxID=1491 RepID=UPI000773E32A|nr:hypothetical protein [Clostridium botulinum]APH20825.1 hypothetical protein NPD1_4157 [Clostridium botulinum]APQ71155.1 hypothetical protein RSJ8_4114 [Clostridium botulinum]MBD5589316.1 hypothetical protein [Clostridium botulinum]MBN3379034.1 hypothetical protein [Clostridium botulinum]
MARKVKCPICNKLNEKEDAVEIKKRYYCKECAKRKEDKTKRNKDNWDELFQYICNLYNIKTLNGFMFKQLKEFREEYGYTNAGILLTLKYYYETLENEVKEGTGLGIVPYYYEKAKEQFLNVSKIRKKLKDFKDIEKETTIKISPCKKNKELTKQLSFEKIKWEDKD